jgi:Tesmin/TSO1-like CXC domain, cysteine-rich domain
MMHPSRQEPPPHDREAYNMTPSRRHIPPPPQAMVQQHHQHASMHPQFARMEMETPMKQNYQGPPQGGYHMQFPPPHHGSGQKPIYPPSAMKNEYHDAPNKPVFIVRSDNPPPAPSTMSSAGAGGNQGMAYPTSSKKSPCNCKKSRCLKLYCDCFANERFCNGCNCVDCQNTPETAAIRDKAIKDTKLKNSKAFQSRIAVRDAQGDGTPQKIHTMGCKCKKSECLKKYCEVRSNQSRSATYLYVCALFYSCYRRNAFFLISVFPSRCHVWRQMQVRRVLECSWIASFD